jgi:hypothetical protein
MFPSMNTETEKEEIEKKSGRPTFIALCGRAFRSDPEFFPQVEYRGRTIVLCTSVCLDAFLADPDRFYATHRATHGKKDNK